MKLVLQPLLENAIYHGMAQAEGEGEIIIEGKKSAEEENILLLTVSDNGCGMPEESVEKLMNGAYQGVNSRGSGVGFYNVNQRIQLTYGKEYGLSLWSEPDEGTVVTVRLPLERKEVEK
ncbi:MAG: ATP-binding protein [Eubacteriales bacterium]